jgi:hypothetical protein
MNATAEQFASANKANVETLLTIANTAFASAERLAALNLNTARAVLEDSVANAKALLAVKDVQQLVACKPPWPSPPSRRPLPTRAACMKSPPRPRKSCPRSSKASSPK